MNKKRRYIKKINFYSGYYHSLGRLTLGYDRYFLWAFEGLIYYQDKLCQLED